MEGLRRNIRAWSCVWLLCQAAFLTAFIPRECCAAHRSRPAPCHESAPAAQCPMRTAGGEACPMHRSAAPGDDGAAISHDHAARHPVPADTTCRLRGTCDGPLAALAHLFSHAWLPPQSQTPSVAPPPVERVAVTASRAIGRAEPPDSPPPRLQAGC